VQAFLRVNPSGTVSAYRGNASSGGGTLLGSSSLPLMANVFNYLEIKITIDNSAGVFIVRLNGNPTPILNLTGQDTQSQATSAWNGLQVGRVSSGGGTQTCRWDDLYVLDGTGSAPWNTFLGDVRVDARLPTGAGTTTGWTPSTGSNYAAVDDAAPNSDTDYVAATSTPLTDTYVFQDVPVAGSTVLGVQHCIYAKKIDGGTCAIAPVVRHSSTDYVGSDLFPGTSYGYGLLMQPTNPGTSAQWTESDFNAAEFGVKRTA